MLITTKLIVVFLTISLIPLFIFAFIIYLQTEQYIKKETLDKLDAIASIQKNRVQTMLDQNIERLIMFTNRIQLKDELDQYNKQKSIQSQQFINNLLDSAKSDIPSFKDISILDTNGIVVASTNKEIGSNQSKEEYFLNGINHNDVTIIFKDKASPNTIREYLTGPLVLNGKTIGVAAIESDSASNFFTAFQNNEGLGQTGEFYVAEKDKNGDALLISPLRNISDTSLNFKVSKNETDSPIIQATILKKEKIITDAQDYRGEPVLSATRYIKAADWGLVVKIDKKEAFASLDNLKYLIIFTGTIIGFLIIIASLVLGKSITKPIINLRNAAKEIANGNLDVKLKEIDNFTLSKNKGGESKDEIKDLAFQFDKMRQNIRSTNTNLQELIHQKTKDLEKVVEELKEKEIHLIEANKKLQLLDKLKNDFINIAAHELRTPTQAILTFADLLPSYPDKKEIIETIQRNARRLKRLIRDILDVTKIESQKLVLRKEIFNVTDLVYSIIEEYREQIKKSPLCKNIKFYFLFPNEKDLFVYADKERITQVISNLLDNSIKFIEDEGSIYISIKKISRSDRIKYNTDLNKEDQVIISIRDTGTGILEEIYPKLFTKFATKSITGTGLGLYISKSIIEAHGGQIWAENNDKDKGAKFSLKLPLIERENIHEIVESKK
jgi:signal transduction histidine kinase